MWVAIDRTACWTAVFQWRQVERKKNALWKYHYKNIPYNNSNYIEEIILLIEFYNLLLIHSILYA